MSSSRNELGTVWKGLGPYVGLGMAFSVGFGVLHDLFSVAMCEPYLRDYHPHTGLTGPVLALYWGFMATFWVGAFGGLTMGLFGQIGSWPRLPARTMAKFMAAGSLVLLLCSIGFWFGVYRFAERARENVTRQFGAAEFESRRRLVTTASMHAFSYMGSTVLVALGCLTIVVRRRKEWRQARDSEIEST